MIFEFKVVRRTICLEEHSVSIRANSLDAKFKVMNDEGEHLSLDRDEPQSSEIVASWIAGAPDSSD